jgi:hypothetical protein
MKKPIREFKIMLRHRNSIKKLEAKVRKFLTYRDIARPNNLAEVRATVLLAVHHLENARMRLDMAVQYGGDIVSIYDKRFFNNECVEGSYCKMLIEG